jgi:hypothetical protein
VIVQPGDSRAAQEADAVADADEEMNRESPKSPADTPQFLEDRFYASEHTEQGKEIEQQLFEAFDAAEIKREANLKSVECRGANCRLEVSFAESDSDRIVVEKLFASPDAKMDMAGTIPVREENEDGSVDAVVYLYKPERVPEPVG